VRSAGFHGGDGVRFGHPVPVDRNRLLLALGAIAAAVVVVVVVIVAFGFGGSSSSATTSTASTATSAGGGSGGGGGNEAVSTFAGVAQHGDTLGKATAPVTLFVFEDPQCPFCRQWNLDTLPTVVKSYVRTGRIKLVYRGIVVIGENSVAGLRAVYAAGIQNKLWNMAEALYERQGEENSGWITVPVIRQAAKTIGVNPAKLIADADASSVTADLQQAANEEQTYGVQGTPTFAIQKQLGPVQQLVVAGLEPDTFTSALDSALQ
jgi:protein-disulfide isomerase